MIATLVRRCEVTAVVPRRTNVHERDHLPALIERFAHPEIRVLVARVKVLAGTARSTPALRLQCVPLLADPLAPDEKAAVVRGWAEVTLGEFFNFFTAPYRRSLQELSVLRLPVAARLEESLPRLQVTVLSNLIDI